MEHKVQDHQKELERLRQNSKLEKARLIHEAQLKMEMRAVSEFNMELLQDVELKLAAIPITQVL